VKEEPIVVAVHTEVAVAHTLVEVVDMAVDQGVEEEGPEGGGLEGGGPEEGFGL
jgi:hypothetical protein